jgi:hypothetical protein
MQRRDRAPRPKIERLRSFEEPGCAHAATDAHRDDAVLAAAASQLVQ